MRLTILGSSASYAGPGQACAGYLVRTDSSALLLDCGNGVLSNLGKVFEPLELDAVFVTHGHVDHFADLYVLHALLRYAPDGPAAPLDLYLPEGLFERIGAILGDRGYREFAEAFIVHPIHEGDVIRIGTVTVSPRGVDHVEPTFALRLEHEGATLCYTSDSAPGARLDAAAAGADLLLAEATLPEQYAGRAPHLTAREAGELATRADAGRLVLTHVWPANNRDEMATAACATYLGPIHIAKELDDFDVLARGARRGE